MCHILIVPDDARLSVRGGMLSDAVGADDDLPPDLCVDLPEAVAEWVTRCFSYGDDDAEVTKNWIVSDLYGEDLGPVDQAAIDEVNRDFEETLDYGDGSFWPDARPATLTEKKLAVTKAKLAEQWEAMEQAAMQVARLYEICLLGKRTQSNWEEVQRIVQQLERVLPLDPP